jgi:hypothetical protein
MVDHAGALEGEEAFAAELDFWESSIGANDGRSLVDLINRVLDKGVVITGHVTISVAGVDLVYLGLNAVLTSVASARERAREARTRMIEGGLDEV